MTTISNHKIQILEDLYEEAETDLSFREWVEQEADEDPGFFRFLFGEPFEKDFDTSLTEEHIEAYEEFLSEIE